MQNKVENKGWVSTAILSALLYYTLLAGTLLAVGCGSVSLVDSPDAGGNAGSTTGNAGSAAGASGSGPGGGGDAGSTQAAGSAGTFDGGMAGVTGNDGGGGVGGVGSTPFVRSTTSSFVSGKTDVACTLKGVVAGDVLFAVVHSSGMPGVAASASDDAGDSYTYAQDWSVGVAGAVARAKSNGDVVVTVSAGNTTAGLSLFCYDLVGVTLKVTISSGTGMTANISAPSISTSSGSVAVGLWATYGQSPGVAAGAGFTLTTGSPISADSGNFVSSEYDVSASSTTGCPMTASQAQQWGGACFVLDAVSSLARPLNAGCTDDNQCGSGTCAKASAGAASGTCCTGKPDGCNVCVGGYITPVQDGIACGQSLCVGPQHAVDGLSGTFPTVAVFSTCQMGTCTAKQVDCTLAIQCANGSQVKFGPPGFCNDDSNNVVRCVEYSGRTYVSCFSATGTEMIGPAP